MLSDSCEDQNNVDKMRKILKACVECKCFETVSYIQISFFSFFFLLEDVNGKNKYLQSREISKTGIETSEIENITLGFRLYKRLLAKTRNKKRTNGKHFSFNTCFAFIFFVIGDANYYFGNPPLFANKDLS